MKSTLKFSILVFTLVFTSCSKDEISPPTLNFTNSETQNSITTSEDIEDFSSRSGLRDNIFFRKSLTVDNWLNVPFTEEFRTHTIFNKRKIQTINFQKTNLGSASINGVLCSHYRIQVVYTDGAPSYVFTAYSKDSLNQFSFNPASSLNLLTSSHTGKVVKLELQRPGLSIWNWWRDETYLYNLCVVYKDGVEMGRRYIDPVSKESKLYILPYHTH
jgi:hypothetical protein